LFILPLMFIQLSAQENRQYEKYMHPNDSILMVNLPVLELPDSYKGLNAKDLPDYHNNSEHPYFRPIFNQYGWSCGQASTVGYNFTYEINRSHNTSASNIENQYPPLFAFNFFNRGEDGIGVCYLYTLDAIKHNGNPNVIDYGGMGENLTHWATGYDIYYNGMFNKIDEIYAIHVGDEEGLLTLKHYLYDHLEGSPFGGIVNFYADMYSFTYLPTGTPEEGKAVITAFGSYTGHSMTFLGWNDSIRWDYNNDGQYTNDIDINGDGDITMKDWEIGGVILANSWGDDWADSGFCYVMYNVLAMEKLEGGIWNKQVNVIQVKEDYEPQITYKVKLTHDSRNKIKVMAGVSADTNNAIPQYTLEFPIFNYQGGDNYMQGDNSGNEFKTLEFGLDVTPLLSYIASGEPARFFFQVHENDPSELGTGEINQFSLMDYISGGIEVSCQDSDVPLNENSTTSLSVVHTLTWDDIEIENDELPAFASGQPYTTQMSASGGMEPYKWNIAPVYIDSEYEENYPEIIGQQIFPGNNQDGHAIQVIEFPFPFFDRHTDTVYMYVDGFLMFDNSPYPLPYQVEDMLAFKNESVVSAFMNKEMFVNTGSGNKLWYEGDENYAAFRWETQVGVNGTYCPVDITTILYPDGTIEIYHDEYSFPDQTGRITGVSNGDGINFLIAGDPYSSHSDITKKFIYTPQNYPSETTISNDGTLSFTPLDENKIYTISVRVTDDFNISDMKAFQLSDGIIYNYTVQSGDDQQIDYGEIAHLDFMLKNISSQAIADVVLSVETNDPFVTWIDDSELIGTIEPGESIVLNDAISFTMDSLFADNHNFTLNVFITSVESIWESKINLTAYAPSIIVGSPVVNDGDNNRLDPGETVDVIIPIINNGHTVAEDLEAIVITDDTFITINNNSGTLHYGNIPSGGTAHDTINLSVDEDTPQGHLTELFIAISVEPDIQLFDSLNLLVGRYPVFVADLDPELLSGPYIKSSLEDLNVTHFYDYYIPASLEDFQNIFVTLGRNFGQHILTEAEGQKLADFLWSGGNVYMEGGLTWYDDPQTPVHPLFHIDPQYVSWNEIDSVIGNEGSFADSMKFDYMGEMLYYNYHLLPTGASYPIFHSSEEDHNFAIAYAGDNYKTVGSILDFGGFVNGQVPSTRYHLLGKILEFFDVDVIITGMNEYETSLHSNAFNCYPNPVHNDFRISFMLDDAQTVSVTIYDVHGKKMASLADQEMYQSGLHKISGDASIFPSGVYICTLRTESAIKTIKLLKAK